MNIYYTIIAIYLLTGIVRVIYEFTHKDAFSPSYVLRPKERFFAIVHIFWWPIASILRMSRFLRRKQYNKFFSDYLLPIAIGSLIIFGIIYTLEDQPIMAIIVWSAFVWGIFGYLRKDKV
ncbi:MAG TPA: hypothetical protein ENH26_01935 [Candidatus Wolfebacteria bacterium]|nr:hypothetical protein [Candidatus Wolfebacteria bacterium]